MRIVIPLFVLSLLGAYAVHEVSGACNTSDVQLKYNQLGESFIVYVTGDDEDDEAEQALKGSPGGAFTFGPPDVDAYNIRFAQGVQVDTFRFEIRLSSSVRIRAFQDGAFIPAYDRNVTLSGNKWRLRKRVFGVNLFNVVKITITWVATSSELGLKNIVINACATAPCVPDQTVNTNTNLDPPTGFTIDIPGPILIDGGFNTNPVAVLNGSESKVRLRNLLPNFYNYIKITSISVFNVSEINIETKQGIGVLLVAFSDVAGNAVLFVKSDVTYNVNNWIPFTVNSIIGQIFNVRRLDIYVIYGTNMAGPEVFVRNLYFNTCQ